MKSKFFLQVGFFLLTQQHLAAQSDSIAFVMPFYFQDAIGNRDTVYVGASEYADGSLRPEWGEENLIDEPFDSIFEVRLTRTEELFDNTRIPETLTKTLIRQMNDFGTVGDCQIVINAPSFVTAAKYPPVSISWSNELFAEGAILACAKGTFIINSLSPYSIPLWYLSADEIGIDYTCIGATLSGEIAPWEGEFPGGPGFNDFAVHYIEGSTNQQDTLMANHLFWARTTAEPCAGPVDLDEADLISPVSSLFPNPARTTINIELAATEELSQINVLTATGRRIFYAERHQESINVSNWPPGIHLLRYRTKSGWTGAERFIKQ